LILLLLVAVSGVVGYEYYSRSVGGDHPEESINVLLLAVEKVEPAPATGPQASLQAAAVLTIDPRSGQAAVVTLPATVLMPGAEVRLALREPSGAPASRGDGTSSGTSLQEDGGIPAATSPDRTPGIDRTLDVDTAPDSEEPLDILEERYRLGGVQGVKEAVQQLLNVPVHYHVQVDFEGFVQAVDRLQGLPVTVDMPIVYRDGEGNEIFRLDPGEHRLDGRAALYYLRYRGNDWLGEAPRAQRHRAFFESLGRTVLRQVSVSELPSYLELYRAYVTTDLDMVQMVRLAEMVWRAQPETIEVVLLPGQAQEGFWKPDPAGVQQLVTRLFYHPAAASPPRFLRSGS